jgi:hypothetical protein
MNTRALLLAVAGFAASALVTNAQTVLAVDFNMRAQEAVTQGGFSSFVITSNGTATAAQTGAVTRAFSGINVTLSGSGSNPGYNDRLRSTPTDSGDLTQAWLYRDFVFSSDTGSGGLNVTVDGLVPDQVYQVSIWSFDAGTTTSGTRYSDWSANGFLRRSGYSFFGGSANLPTNNTQYQITFKSTANASGQIAIQGRRVAPTASSQVAVFINALQLDLSTPDAPANLGGPADVDLYRGDNAVFTVATTNGTPPFTYHWLFNGNPLVSTTVPTIIVSNIQPGLVGGYSVIVSNPAGTDTSSVAQLTMREVQNINSGLIAYWPLDIISDVTPDLTGEHPLWVTNMIPTNVVFGARSNALAFNGVDSFLTRTNEPTALLPAYNYPAYTIAMWVKGNGTNQSDKRVFSESSNITNNPLFTIGTDNTGTSGVVDIFLRFNNGGNPLNHKKSSLVAFDDQWHHIAWVDNNGVARVFVDGVQDPGDFSYARGVLTSTVDSVGGIFRASATPAATAFFNGQIDDVAIWRRALAQDEIKYVRNNGAVRKLTQITSIGVGETTVTLTVAPVDPNGTYTVQETADLSTVPGSWSSIANTSATRNGDVLTFQFLRNGGTKFFRIPDYTQP